jgi:hypothetical protein
LGAWLVRPMQLRLKGWSMPAYPYTFSR